MGMECISDALCPTVSSSDPDRTLNSGASGIRCILVYVLCLYKDIYRYVDYFYEKAYFS